ncbi:MAG: hypothetical protein PVS3B1_00230 [Ktedonobacteraceae bacterium]
MNHVIWSCKSLQTFNRGAGNTTYGMRARSSFLPSFCLLVLLFSACSSFGSADTPPENPPQQKVNGFGSAQNHVHSFLSFPGNVLVLATHYGLFRSTDDGKSWTLRAAGPGQLMDGMMTFSLTSSPLDPQRLYVLTQPSVNNPKGIQALYTSADQGVTWQMGVKTADIGAMYFVAAGNDSANEVYTYVSSEGAQGFKVSKDNGKSFSSPGALPFGRILGMLAVPGSPDNLLVYSNDGVARSLDGGAHWTAVQGVDGAVYGMTTAAPHSPIYASGDAGIYSSQDGGKSFKLVYTAARYGALTASPVQAQEIYGKTGRSIYESTDGGHSWKTLPPIKGNLESLTPAANDASRLYLALSYPTEVYRYDKEQSAWVSLTPKA